MVSVYKSEFVATAKVVSTSNDDDEGSENVVKKRNLRPFKPSRVYLDRLICQM